LKTERETHVRDAADDGYRLDAVGTASGKGICVIGKGSDLSVVLKQDRERVQRSGVERLENYLASEIIPIKRQLLAKAVTSEIGVMMTASQKSLVGKH
jgi:hypothetical protein